MKHFLFSDKGIFYTTKILLAFIIVWYSLSWFQDTRKIWALISVIVVSEPDIQNLRNAVVSRIINTVTGCLLGLLFIYAFGVSFWSMLCALAVSILAVTSYKKYPSSWKLAPITVLIVMLPELSDTSSLDNAMHIALRRTMEVLYGCFVAFILGLLFSRLEKIWQNRPQEEMEDRKTQGGQEE